MKKYKVVLDCMGSDKGVEMMVRGASLALSEREELELMLVGDGEAIVEAVKREEIDPSRVEIVSTSEVITNYDSPAEALFTKRNSSLVVALSALAKREDLVGLVNAGSTGALIAGAMMHLSLETRVRPALAALLPAERGGFVCLVDTGATIDCGPETLAHFARLGSDFMRDMYGIENPRVGLLSNGKESTKGNKAVKAAHAILAEDDRISFVGNIEGTNALSGDCDVLACDGFAGNQVLKVTEGTARRIITDIVKIAKSEGREEYMALAGQLMKRYDFNSLGGGIILGVRKPVIKAHGASNEQSIKNVIHMILNLAANKQAFEGRE
ncbi:MAG: phosphate acyltransferase PlsX [Clostridia bacterium]|nr:phosphate acyltransferase PlsX [Clostridia bacterium]